MWGGGCDYEEGEESPSVGFREMSHQMLQLLPLNIFSTPKSLFKFLSFLRSSLPLPWETPLPTEGLSPSNQNLPANDSWLQLRQEVGACKASK